MKEKIIATVVGLTLVSLAAVGAFASQDGVSLPAVIGTETPTGTDTPGPSPTSTDIASTETPVATGTASETSVATTTPSGTTTPAPTDTPSAGSTATPTSTGGEGGGSGDGVIHGIPESNPNHQGGDLAPGADCTKGATVIKKTPSGNLVRVPCQTQKHLSHAAGTHGDGSTGP